MDISTHTWLRNAGISDNIITILLSNAFNTREALATMQPEDPQAMGVQPLGQIRMLLTITKQENAVDSISDRIGSIMNALPSTDGPKQQP